MALEAIESTLPFGTPYVPEAISGKAIDLAPSFVAKRKEFK